MIRRLLTVGAVASGPADVERWEQLRARFEPAPVGCDYVLFSTYESLLHALLNGRVDVAWDSALAYARLHAATDGTCRVLATSEPELRVHSMLVTHGDGVRSLRDLNGRAIALGSSDSVESCIMPVHLLRRAGVDAGRDVRIFECDRDIGKHGDTGRGDVEALRALLRGEVAAVALGTSLWGSILPADDLRAFWRSPPYAGKNFTALASIDGDVAAAWTTHLLSIHDHDGARFVEPDLNAYGPVFDALEERQFSTEPI